MPAKPRDRQSGAIEAKRIPIERAVDVSFPHFQGFVTEVSANLSMTGMFVRSDHPQPAGTELRFRFRIEDWKLIQGTAQVAWTRERDEAPNRPSGMGVRFLELDAQSRRMVRWLVERYIHEGGKPFELTGARKPGPSPASDRTGRSSALAGAAIARSTWHRRRQRRRAAWGAVGALLLLVAAGGIALAWWNRAPADAVAGDATAPPRRANDDRAVDPPAQTAEATPETTADRAPSGPPAADPAGAAPAEVGQMDAGSPDPVAELVGRWADAWSAQRDSEYLDFYADDFLPPGGMSRAAWAELRRSRISTPRFIEIGIDRLETEQTGADRASATFVQLYRSDRFADQVEKRLDLVREGGEWRILRETIAP